eukprot:m.777542 g.777542  ORF g.777542 m.777542 type:complete len:669 (+) comp23266_c0_seq2:99-2105(+)
MTYRMSTPYIRLLLLVCLVRYVRSSIAFASGWGHSNVLANCSSPVVFNHTGCTAGGNYNESRQLSPSACCSACSTDPDCVAWTFHAEFTGKKPNCFRATHPVLARNSDTQRATCGCKVAEQCVQPSPPPPPSGKCVPVYRPPVSRRSDPPLGFQPHFVSILLDDLGFDDTSIRNGDINFTPNMARLKDQGILLDRHHTYLWCSPTRRAFLSGRYPVHITGTQAPLCSNFLPLQFTTLSEKLAAVGYESHMIGKAHLGFQTVDHLPVNRGFTSHVGYLGGGEKYAHGVTYGGNKKDMWSNDAPGVEAAADMYYSTNYYASAAVDRIQARNTSKPFWLHLTYQAVHAPYSSPPPWELVPAATPFRSQVYGSMLAVADAGIGNITAALKASGMWERTLLVLAADNGGDCGLLSGAASNHPLLGRKCTAFDGGTRVAALVAGGVVPAARRGSTSSQLLYITDWYPTFCNLAGVDAADDYVDPATNASHPIDGVDAWPALLGERNVSRQWLPTTERSLIYVADSTHMWKLITDEHQANRFYPNGTQYMDTYNPCLPGATPQHAAQPTSTRAPDGGAGGDFNVGEDVPPSCVVCSAQQPCLYELFSDPTEKINLAAGTMPAATKAVLDQMVSRLVSYVAYVPTLSPDNLLCYNCSATWGIYAGPCCIANTTMAL